MPPSHKTPQQNQQKNIQQFNKFLKNNNQLILQKYKQHFKQDKIKINSKQLKIEAIVNFIADVFLIQGNQQKQDKKQNNKKDNQDKIRQSLRQSYQSFIKINKDIKEFNATIAVQLLRFCIESNQMFAVQYQNSRQNIQNKMQKETTNQNNQQLQNTNKQIQQKQNLQQRTENNQHKQSDKDSPSQSNQFALMKGPSQQNSTINQKNKIKNKNSYDNGQLQNQFNFHEEFKLQLDPMQVKKNLRIVFQYYCKQQMALAPNLSFDRISRQSHMLTLNKILLMARMMKMISGAITREVIVSKFRKISQGKKQIDFKKFDILMSQLQIQDSTLIARAQLNSPNINVHLKTTKKPFDTQDMQPRQLVKVRAFTNKLTEHSGKLQQDLLYNLKQRKSAIIQQNKSKLSPSIIKMKQYSQSILRQIKDTKDTKDSKINKQFNASKELQSLNSKQSEIFNPKRLARRDRNLSYDLSLIKIQKIISVQNQDQKWLGQYKIASSLKRAQAYDQNLQKRRSFQSNQRNSILIQNLKNRIKQVEMAQHPSNSLDQTKPFLISHCKKY